MRRTCFSIAYGVTRMTMNDPRMAHEYLMNTNDTRMAHEQPTNIYESFMGHSWTLHVASQTSIILMISFFSTQRLRDTEFFFG